MPDSLTRDYRDRDGRFALRETKPLDATLVVVIFGGN